MKDGLKLDSNSLKLPDIGRHSGFGDAGYNGFIFGKYQFRYENYRPIDINGSIFPANIYSGYLLKWEKYNQGMKLITICLCLQPINFKFGGLYFYVANGIALNAGLNFTQSISTDFSFHISQAAATLFS